MKEENLDYKKACEEAIDSLEEEFKNGAKAMLSFIQREATGCFGLNCNCIVCEAGKKFLRKRFHNQGKTKPSGLQSKGKSDILAEPENSADMDGASFVGAGDLQDKNSPDTIIKTEAKDGKNISRSSKKS